MRSPGCLPIQFFSALILVIASCTAGPLMAQTSAPSALDSPSPVGGPIRLRQPQSMTPEVPQSTDRTKRDDRTEPLGRDDRRGVDDPPRYKPGEFELYLQQITNDISVRRFGAELVIEGQGEKPAQEVQPVVPPDYRLSAGDELLVSIWGSIDADLRLTIDRSGRVNIPRVGSVMVSGTALSDVGNVIDKQARRVFKNFELSVSVGQLRGMRVFVSGFAVRPGAYSVGSLATLSSVLFLKAGGPSASGSFRDIELRRSGRTVAKFDLYDLVLFGRREPDLVLQADDVIHIGAVGNQVALIGSVNKPAIFEVKPNESVGDLLRMAGGFSSVADRSRLAVERLVDRNDSRIRELALPQDAAAMLSAGEVVRAFSAVDATLPQQRQNRRIRVEGEVARPGDYILPPQSSVADALLAAGGLTPAAFPFGTEFSRETVRKTQQLNYERALRDLELEISKRATSSTARTADDSAAAAQQQAATDRLLLRLRETRPTGRVVLQLAPDGKDLPNIALEDGDRITIPALPHSVGVFGSVFNAGSYLFLAQRTIGDYLNLAGSTTRGADVDSIFVVRANGSVVSARQKGGSYFSFGRSDFASQAVFPGDTVFVPEELNKTTFVQAAKDWTQILYQLGIGIAGIKSAVQ